MKRQHEKQAATPCARLLERKDLSPEQRGRLEALLAANAPIEMRQRIEQQLKALYSLRAQLKQEEEERPEAVPGGEKATPPGPATVRGRACARRKRALKNTCRKARRERKNSTSRCPPP